MVDELWHHTVNHFSIPNRSNPRARTGFLCVAKPALLLRRDWRCATFFFLSFLTYSQRRCAVPTIFDGLMLYGAKVRHRRRFVAVYM